jgi:predicted nucleic acid-binding protein
LACTDVILMEILAGAWAVLPGTSAISPRSACRPFADVDAEGRAEGPALLSELRRRGEAIDVCDAMQAGICLELGATLVTRNVSHFERVPGLRISDPADWPRLFRLRHDGNR